MPKPRLNDIGSIWKTIRELDVNAIRHEAERDVAIACAGDPLALAHADWLLRGGPNRYPLEANPLRLIPLDTVGERLRDIAAADLLIVTLDATAILGGADLAGLESLVTAERPRQILLLLGEPAGRLPAWVGDLDRRTATVFDPRAAGAAGTAAAAVLDALPADLHLAAARHMPGLRPVLARRLIAEVSLSNGVVAVASGVPSLVPVLGIPIAAADSIVLTKNQGLMVYRLALAYGARPEFQRRMAEIAPVVGAAVVWRQVAGGLVGLIPGYGIVPKTVVAYAGTYIVGRTAERWYETGLVSEDELRRITADATAKAKAIAADLSAQARRTTAKAGSRARERQTKASTLGNAAGARARQALGGARARTTRALRRRKGADAGPSGPGQSE